MGGITGPDWGGDDVGVDTGGTHCVQTVEVLVLVMVEIVVVT